MEVCAACQRKKKRSPEEEKKLKNRLERISGQIRGLIKMVEEDAYCPDILLQTRAVREALSSFSRQLLEEHIRTCVAEDLKNGKETAAEELVDTLRGMLK